MSEIETPAEAERDQFTDPRTLEEKVTAPYENWKPHIDDEEVQPNPLAGLVLEVGERVSGYSDDNVPAVRVLDAEGVEWSVVGFHTMLRAELLRVNPRIGDRLGLYYRGEGVAKEGQAAPHMYRAVVERNPAGPQEPDPELKPSEPAPDDDIPF